MRHKSSLHSPNHRFVIALHSPDGFLRTGLPVSPPEKRSADLAFWVQHDTFSESGSSAKDAKLRGFSAIFGGKPQSFSAVETAWRRERDSNPRTLSGIAVFKRVRPFRLVSFQSVRTGTTGANWGLRARRGSLMQQAWRPLFKAHQSHSVCSFGSCAAHSGGACRRFGKARQTSPIRDATTSRRGS